MGFGFAVNGIVNNIVLKPSRKSINLLIKIQRDFPVNKYNWNEMEVDFGFIVNCVFNDISSLTQDLQRNVIWNLLIFNQDLM